MFEYIQGFVLRLTLAQRNSETFTVKLKQYQEVILSHETYQCLAKLKQNSEVLRRRCLILCFHFLGIEPLP